MNNARLSINEAARLLNASPQFIRIGLRQNVFPWGYAVKTSSQYTYFVIPKKFEECTGIKVPEMYLNYSSAELRKGVHIERPAKNL